jgi:redox-sensitive bicupin YhaK (pirin superfamily)
VTHQAILAIRPLGFPWVTLDPFLFCVHHDDVYPPGNKALGPDASLAGRQLGNDFAGKDGWRMYHGQTVPGFPAHPHRGFETVTIVRRGLIDHSDSLGATARFGSGDVQWLTAGRGIVHAEMFPLIHQEARNPLELFQIWLNLPARNKMVDPTFTMFWSDNIPRHTFNDAAGRRSELVCVAGRFAELTSPVTRPTFQPAPPPNSRASDPDADLAIWTLKMAAGARWTLPAATSQATHRNLYFFKGGGMTVAGREIPSRSAIELRGDAAVEIIAGGSECECLLLQGRPIGEPVAQYGPFVMNTAAEIQQAYADYQRTQFGGWPFPNDAPVHAAAQGRFARHADGKLEPA